MLLFLNQLASHLVELLQFLDELICIAAALTVVIGELNEVRTRQGDPPTQLETFCHLQERLALYRLVHFRHC